MRREKKTICEGIGPACAFFPCLFFFFVSEESRALDVPIFDGVRGKDVGIENSRRCRRCRRRRRRQTLLISGKSFSPKKTLERSNKALFYFSPSVSEGSLEVSSMISLSLFLSLPQIDSSFDSCLVGWPNFTDLSKSLTLDKDILKSSETRRNHHAQDPQDHPAGHLGQVLLLLLPLPHQIRHQRDQRHVEEAPGREGRQPRLRRRARRCRRQQGRRRRAGEPQGRRGRLRHGGAADGEAGVQQDCEVADLVGRGGGETQDA